MNRSDSNVCTCMCASVYICVLHKNYYFLHCSPKRIPFPLPELGNAVLMTLDGSGRKVEGRELWRERGAVIMMVRRPG